MRSGATAAALATSSARKGFNNMSGNATNTNPQSAMSADVSRATCQTHLSASSGSPRPIARPASAPADRPIPQHGSATTSSKLSRTFAAPSSTVPMRPIIQNSTVMPEAYSVVVRAWLMLSPPRVRTVARLGMAAIKPRARARINPCRKYRSVPNHVDAVVPRPAPSTPSAGMPRPGTPNISAKLSTIFAACMEVIVCRYTFGCPHAFQYPRNE
mmetsp:Transcript_10847/g.44955  ORF Transcript_10847/g.44955 Transcript_10847/m.44955 type:complete len:214 (-) Transcript_10847:542-1183(-)